MERSFLGWDRPALDTAAERLVARALRDDPEGDLDGDPDGDPDGRGPVDLRAVTVLLPGGRAGRTLVEHLVRHAAAAGRGVLLPRVVTPRGLIEGARSTRAVPPSSVESRLAWIAAVAALSRERLAHLIPEAENAPPSALVRTALRLDRVTGELGEEGRTIEGVLEAAGRRGSPEERDRLRVFGALAEDAARRLARAGRRAGFVHPPEVADRDPGPVIAIGLADPRPRARAVLESLTDLEAWVHAPEEFADRFGALGDLDPDAAAALVPELRFPEDTWRIADTPVGQAARAEEAVRAALARGLTPTLCVLDPEVRPLVVDRLRAAGIPVHDAAGRPAATTGPGRLVRAIRESLEDGEYAAFAALARHPDVDRAVAARVEPGKHGEGPLGRLDAHHAAALPATVEGIAGAGTPLRVAVQEIIAPLRAPPRPAAEWAEPIGRTLDRLLLGTGVDDPALGALGDALDALAAVPDTIDGPITAALALRLVEEELASATVRADRDPRAIELVGWLEVEWDPSPALIVVGANEGSLPGRTGGADPLLPPRLREELGLPGDDARLARDALIVRTLLASDRETTWIAGRRGTDGDPRHPSRFWLAEESPRAARVRRFYETDEAEPSPPALLPSRDDARPALAIPEPVPPEEPITRVAVTALGGYLRCPYTFYLQRVLRLEEVHDRADELDPLRFGILLHDVLEALGNDPAVRHSNDPDAVESFLLDTLSDRMRSAHGPSMRAALRIQQELMRARLEAFARWQVDSVRTGWRIHACEASIPSAAPNFRAGDLHCTLSGTIDRIDLHEDGIRGRIIDYKTGEGGVGPEKAHRAGPRNAKRWISLQLPLYRHLAHLLDVDREWETGFTLLPRDPDGVRFEPAEWTEEEHADAIETAGETLLAIHAGVFWPPRALSTPWNRIFDGETIGALDRLSEIGIAEAADEKFGDGGSW